MNAFPRLLAVAEFFTQQTMIPRATGSQDPPAPNSKPSDPDGIFSPALQVHQVATNFHT
jgi:hypothetical protein